MSDTHNLPLGAILRLSIALALAGCSSAGTAPGAGAPAVGAHAFVHRASGSSSDLYIGNILGGVLLYSTDRNPQEVGDISDQLPRVTGVWVDQRGVLYAFTDNANAPFETIEEFQSGASSPFFSLALQHDGTFVAADAQQNVYAQGENEQEQQVIDVYPPGAQAYSNEYVVPAIGQRSEPESMAFDPTGALLVGVTAHASNKRRQIGVIFRLNQASATFENLNLQKAYGGVIATDAKGTLYVGGDTLISVYAPGATSPSRIIHTKEPVLTLTVASGGTLYVSMYGGGIFVYSPGKNHARSSFDPQAQVSGLALGPG